MRLPRNLELEVKSIVNQIEEERRVAYVTSVERIAREEGARVGMQQGIQEGEAKGRRESALAMIQDGVLDDATITRYTGLSAAETEALRRENGPH